MIASQKVGKSFMGALGYNLKKVNHPDSWQRAEVLESNFVSFDKRLIALEVEHIRQLRPALNKYVYHTSLNFSKEEESGLTNDKLLQIAKDYLEGMGFNNNQYMIFRHYDADHPHIHLLANRITFDGEVVSDSNNYNRSEKLLRELEYRYNLIAIVQSKYVAKERKNNIEDELRNRITEYQSNQATADPDNKRSTYRRNNVSADKRNPISIERRSHVSRSAPKKSELEMVIRKGEPSGKMLLQEKLSLILEQKRSMQDFIQQCEAEGICLLFNQASTGYISGITYFLEDFKAKGQALGGLFKWAEIIKQIDYEQIRDSETVSQANSRTKAKYGDFTQAGNTIGYSGGKGNAESLSGNGENTGTVNEDRSTAVGTGKATEHDSSGTKQEYKNTNHSDRDISVPMYHDTSDQSISITDDVDDEAVYGKNRKRKGYGR